MNVKQLLLGTLIVLLFVLGGIDCEKTDQGSSTATTDNSGEITGDSDDDDSTGCTDAVELIYNCGYFFYDSYGNVMSKNEALIECLALSEITNAWICRLNCGEVLTDCGELYDCLVVCPETE